MIPSLRVAQQTLPLKSLQPQSESMVRPQLHESTKKNRPTCHSPEPWGVERKLTCWLKCLFSLILSGITGKQHYSASLYDFHRIWNSAECRVMSLEGLIRGVFSDASWNVLWGARTYISFIYEVGKSVPANHDLCLLFWIINRGSLIAIGTMMDWLPLRQRGGNRQISSQRLRLWN